MIRKATLGILIALGVALAAPSLALADDVAEARSHYQKGQALFAEGDFQAAVYEFEAAERLAPSPLNDFNIALAYEKMGNKVSALRYYKSYLAKMPGARNRGDVESRISRLEGELRADAAKAEARRADEAAAARRAEEARKAAEAAEPAQPAPGASEPPEAGVVPGGAVEGGILGSDGSTPPVAEAPAPAPEPRRPASTGDPELDRVAAIDVGAVRDQRQQALGSSHASFGGDGSRAGSGSAPPPPVPGDPGQDAPEKESKPAYKQWWFWVVVGVSAVILIDIMSTDSDSAATRAAGVTVFSF